VKGALDFWATDAWTDSAVPIFDEWSVEFTLREHIRQVMYDDLMQAFPSLNHCRLDQKPKW
jgi:hypothetical protein